MIRAILASLLFSFDVCCLLLSAQAQVVSDQTIDSQVNLVDERQFIITGGEEAGKNLFHSFSEFSVPANFSVYFNNSANIENIFSRITGGSISEINGLIKANDASLFLLNPAGIIFGAGAELNLGGSFVASTAEAIIFADGIEFSATDTDTEPLLTVNLPIGLQFGATPGEITSNGMFVPDPDPEALPGQQIENPTLATTSNNTLALVGGKVSLSFTRLETITGRAEIGSVSGQEYVAIESSDNGLIFNYDRVDTFSQVELSDSSIFSDGEGSVQIRGREIQLSNRSGIEKLTLDAVDGGDINLIATDLIELDNSFLLTQVGGNEPSNAPTPIIEGDGGDIFIQGSQIILANGSVISAGTLSEGDGGNININAEKSVEISGQNDFLTSLITTATAGNGAGGEIEIYTGNLSLQEGGRILADSFGEGRAGTITVNATESIAISGTEVSIENPDEPLLFMIGFFATSNSGTGGEINLRADSIVLRDDGTISATAGNNGNGGNISIDTDTLVLLDESTRITADAEAGTGGNILINTQGLFVASEVEEQITASSNFGVDGVVEIITPDVDSQIETITVERSPIATEELIYTGCSLADNFVISQFNYIGRGGLPFNPLQEITKEETIADLGIIELPETRNKTNGTNFSRQYQPNQTVTEATTWIVNQKGNIELTAPNTLGVSESSCQFNAIR